MQATLAKPRWINKRIKLGHCEEVKKLLGGFKLNTVCQQALCPNISECFEKKTATFLILGSICSRQCAFCAIGKGIPESLDENEPQRIAQAAKALGLRHVVITSVTRDDLVDAGAGAFAQTIEVIRAINSRTTIEVLVPDFRGEPELIKTVIEAQPAIFCHNLETVPRLYPLIRKGADYGRSLGVLSSAKKIDKKIITKSGIMVGLGERSEEVSALMRDLRACACDFLSIGQYLAPTKLHYPVKEYIEPEQFERYKAEARRFGFRRTESAPYVRSSYGASNYLERPL